MVSISQGVVHFSDYVLFQKIYTFIIYCFHEDLKNVLVIFYICKERHLELIGGSANKCQFILVWGLWFGSV